VSLNAEYNVIGALLLDPDALYRIPNPLQPRDFQKPENRRAYATICKMLKAGKAVDVFLVQEAGGGTVSYLGELAKNTVGSANIAAHATLVKQASRLRQTELALKNGLEQIRVGRPLDEIRQSVMVALEDHQGTPAKSLGELVDETLTRAEEARRLRASSGVININDSADAQPADQWLSWSEADCPGWQARHIQDRLRPAGRNTCGSSRYACRLCLTRNGRL